MELFIKNRKEIVRALPFEKVKEAFEKMNINEEKRKEKYVIIAQKDKMIKELEDLKTISTMIGAARTLRKMADVESEIKGLESALRNIELYENRDLKEEIKNATNNPTAINVLSAYQLSCESYEEFRFEINEILNEREVIASNNINQEFLDNLQTLTDIQQLLIKMFINGNKLYKVSEELENIKIMMKKSLIKS
ncbi:hypothetical protein [Clostridium weizhouense]|uniref:Uncharacterized protein n=1 Tax=Clostridium weizhouense TaxID=2859781 RepID=A0ABS7AQ37_9CLOT|nr:hypothetical protein [Clostridium weizhouense]MBW6410785.1 hypothetical protein [Clostridium weizhouense]